MRRATGSPLPRSLARALPIGAVPARHSPALWADLCLDLALVDAGGLLAALQERGWLRRAGADLVWTRASRGRSASAAALAARDPVRWRRAHQVCAAFFERRGAEGDLALAVDHHLAASDRPAAESILARWGLAAVEGQWVPSLLDALAHWTAGDAPTPPFVLVLQARALERTADLAGALGAYERALAASRLPELRALFGRGPRWLPSRAVIAARAGSLALRVGRLQHAERWLAEARRLSPDAALAAVEHLAARVALARGEIGVAAASFQRAARAAARAHDLVEEAEALSGLGVVAMRAGEPRRAAALYRRALARGDLGDARGARVQANLAMALALTGRFAEAVRLFEEAAETRERLGDLAGAANSLAACAGAREGAGDPAGAWTELARARHLAAMVRDPALSLEIHLIRSTFAARAGEIQVAMADQRAARAIRETLDQPDPLLDAMADEATAELALARRQHAAAASAARRALGAFVRHGAAYLAARVRLLFARNALAANRRASALRHLSAVARSAVPRGYRFPHAHAVPALFELGLAHGDAVTKELCGDALGTGVGVTTRPSTAGAAPYRIVDRSGVRVAQEADLERLRASPPALFVDVPRQRAVTPRGVVSLAGRRVLVPLLLAFLQRPDRALDAEQLHREVWGTDRFDDSARTRLKVALSRLRALIGPGILETRRTTDAVGTSGTVFALSPRVAYALVDRG